MYISNFRIRAWAIRWLLLPRNNSSGWPGVRTMTAFAKLIERRFGDGGPSGGDTTDNEFIRRVIARKTVRRYSDVVPDESLLDLLVAAALSASAKSDFQQASILRVVDPEAAPPSARYFPPCRGSPCAGIFHFSRRRPTSRTHRRVARQEISNGTLEGFFNASVDAALAMQTMILAPSRSASVAVRSASFATGSTRLRPFSRCPTWCFRWPDFVSATRRPKAT